MLGQPQISFCATDARAQPTPPRPPPLTANGALFKVPALYLRTPHLNIAKVPIQHFSAHMAQMCVIVQRTPHWIWMWECGSMHTLHLELQLEKLCDALDEDSQVS